MPLKEDKKCKWCGKELVWTGSILGGKMACPDKTCDVVHRGENERNDPKPVSVADDYDGCALVGDEW